MNAHKREEYKRKLAEKDQEITELKAHVERLKEALTICDQEHNDYYVGCEDVTKALKGTPAQSLQEIKRQAILDMLDIYAPHKSDKVISVSEVEAYAEQFNNLTNGWE